MRVIAGEHRGRTLKAPAGNDTRPTTDRVRESLFSTLVSLRGGFDGAVVLDAFAGSGALGVEALSRGASFCCFCERNRAALGALSANTAFFDRDRYRILSGDVLKRMPQAPGPFDLVFFDPPYALDARHLVGLVDALAASGRMAPDAIVSYERDSASAGSLLSCAAVMELVSEKTYGTTSIDIYRMC